MVEVEGDPTHATQKIDAIIKKAKGDQVNELVSGENINTLRTIDKAETSNRGRAIFIHQIAQTMDADEAKQFILDSYIYFGVKYGVETVKSQNIADVLKYGKEQQKISSMIKSTLVGRKSRGGKLQYRKGC